MVSKVNTPVFKDRKGGMHATSENAAKADAKEIFSRYVSDVGDDFNFVVNSLAERWLSINEDLEGLRHETEEARDYGRSDNRVTV
jgi:hypothetical protein